MSMRRNEIPAKNIEMRNIRDLLRRRYSLKFVKGENTTLSEYRKKTVEVELLHLEVKLLHFKLFFCKTTELESICAKLTL